MINQEPDPLAVQGRLYKFINGDLG